jgi:hypothetical protein
MISDQVCCVFVGGASVYRTVIALTTQTFSIRKAESFSQHNRAVYSLEGRNEAKLSAGSHLKHHRAMKFELKSFPVSIFINFIQKAFYRPPPHITNKSQHRPTEKRVEFRSAQLNCRQTMHVANL